MAPILDYWRELDSAYLVMRCFEHGSRVDVLETGPISADVAMRIIDQIAGSLGAAHRRGITHGYLEPANVLMDAEGNAFVRLRDVVTDRRPRQGDLSRSRRPLRGATAASASLVEIPLDASRWVAKACEIVDRDLTQEEWAASSRVTSRSAPPAADTAVPWLQVQ